MVNSKRIGAGIFGAVVSMLMVTDSQALIPTFDAGNIMGTFQILKDGKQNLDKLGENININGELNTIVGDAAASVSKFKEKYGEDINKGIETAKKAAARAAEAKQFMAEHSAEIEAGKEAYQALMDKTAAANEEETTEEVYEEEVYTEPEVAEVENADNADFNKSQNEEEGYAPSSAAASPMSSFNRQYGDEDEEDTSGGENLDGISGDDEAGELAPKTADNNQNLDIEAMPAAQMAVEEGFATEKTAEISDTRAVQTLRGEVRSSVEDGTSPTMMRAFGRAPIAASAPIVDTGDSMTTAVESKTDANDKVSVSAPATSVPTEIRRFRVSPQIKTNGASGKMIAPVKMEKISHSIYRHSEKLAFASATEGDNVGNPYIGDVFVVPMASRCEMSPETFVKDEKERNKCIETIIRENNASNQFEAAISMKECRRMVYQTVVSLLAEATSSKYEAANYADTLNEQDKLAADSTDVRGDLTIIAMSNQQTQLLLNRISMGYASQLLLDAVKQICATQADILDKKEDASATSGEK